MTNGDRLREMSDDEFEKFLHYKINACCRYTDHCDRCEDCWNEWLKEEAQKNG